MLEGLSQKFTDISRRITGKSVINEKNIREEIETIKNALLEADVNLRVVRRFVNRTTEEALGEKVLRSVNPGQQFIKVVHDRMVDFLGDERQDLRLKGKDTLSVILFLGLQGSGKTTTCAKIAARLKKEGRKVLLAACDLQRPAAVEQLKFLGEKIEVAVFAGKDSDPVKTAKEAREYAKKNLFDTLIVDTAGRMYADEELMEEIGKIKKGVSPDETILAADAMTGQNAVEVAKTFNETVELTGLILTKFDSDTRGGAALSFKSIAKCPIKFIGVGEKIEDIEPFYPERMASRILGMGDIVSLVEKAQDTYSEEEGKKLQKKMAKGNFTLEDLLEQYSQMSKMGDVKKIIDMVPGMSDTQKQEALQKSDVKHKKAIILSMTPLERSNFRMIGVPRRKRIARGSGTTANEVNRLLKEFEKMRNMMKKTMKNEKYREQMMKQFGM